MGCARAVLRDRGDDEEGKGLAGVNQQSWFIIHDAALQNIRVNGERNRILLLCVSVQQLNTGSTGFFKCSRFFQQNDIQVLSPLGSFIPPLTHFDEIDWKEIRECNRIC